MAPDPVLSAARYHETPEDVVFDEPIEAGDILDSGTGVVWGGQMLPDSLPVSNTGCGDVVLLRFNPDGSLREPVEWYHETGTWHPADLRDAYPCRVAALMWQAFEVLESPFHRFCVHDFGGWRLAEHLGMEWSQVSAWLTDTARIPASQRERLVVLASTDDGDAFFFQDWERARLLASESHELRPDLAWPGIVVGRFHERAGRWQEAADWYARSLTGFATTVALTEAWDCDAWSFASRRLGRCLQASDSACPERVAPMIVRPDPSGAVRNYWMERGRRLLKAGDGPGAYESFYRAGWDWYFTNDMDEVLAHLVKAADLAGSKALAALARLHQARV